MIKAGMLAGALVFACAASALATDAPGAADAPRAAVIAPAPNTANATNTLAGVSISSVRYQMPAVQLVRESGQRVSLGRELDDGRPVVMNFIFTTCETTCPLSSQTFSAFQRLLGAERARVHMVSISIDPEQDTPARLRAYAKKFGAGPQWQHYTGTLDASLKAQQAFGAYRGDKMSHTPLTLIRAAPGEPWTRIEGFVTPDQLLQHYHALIAAL
jgi:protein SCO1/2